MEINTDEKEGCAVGMYITDKSAVVYIPANVGYRGKGGCDVRGVMYC